MEVVTVTGKDNQTFVVGVNHGVAGPRGLTGEPAGFDTPTASVTQLSADQNPTVSVTSSGPDTNKQFDFQFGIPVSGVVQADWNQTDTTADDYIENKPDLSLKEDKSNKVTGILGPDVTNSQYPSAKAVVDTIDNVTQGLLSVIDVKEDSANKVTSISDQSTDVQFPSAKCVYDTIQNIDIPDHYEVGEVYMVTRAGLESSSDDIHMRIFKNGVGIRQQTFNMELNVTGGGSVNSIGKYAFTTDMGGYVPPLQEIPFISEFYINYWINGRFSYSTLNVNIYDLDTVTFLCGVTVTRNIVSDTVSDNDARPVISDAVYEYAENKSNKVTSISSQSTDTQYPSAKCVYDSIEAAKKDTYELVLNRMTNNFHPYLIVYKNGRECSNTQFRLTIAVGKNLVGQGENITVTTSEGGGIGHSDLTASQIYNDFWLGDWSLCNSLAITLKDTHSNVLSSISLTRPSIQKSSSSIGSGDTLPTSNAVKSYAEDKSNKVTSLSSSSTNTQYPSAKCVYDAIQAIPVSQQVQSDWNQTTVTEPSYIRNKPTGVSAFTNDAGYVTSSQVPAAQVNSDWNASSGVSQILNKPDLSLKEDKSNKVTSVNSSSTDNQYPSAKCVYDIVYNINTSLNDKEWKGNKVTSIDSSSNDYQYPSAKCVYDAIQAIPSQVQSDWNQTDNTAPDYIKNKPSSTLQEQADWTETNTLDPSYIRNKPDLTLKEDKSNKVTSISASSTNTQYPTAAAVYNAIQNIPAIVGTQSDWTQTDITDPSYIKHKPDLSLKVDTSSIDIGFPGSPSDNHIPSTKLVYDSLLDKVSSAVVGSVGSAKVSAFISAVQDNDTTVPTGHGIKSYVDLAMETAFDNLDYTDSVSGDYVTSVSERDGVISLIKGTKGTITQGSTGLVDGGTVYIRTQDILEGSHAYTDYEIQRLDYTDNVSGDYVTSVSETNGVISVTKGTKGTISSGNTGLVDGGTVYTAVDDVIEGSRNYTNDSIGALDYTDNVQGDYVTSVSESNGIVSLTKGSKGTITSGNTGLVDGGTVYTALQNIPVTTQVQADWSETDTTDPSYIQNKPTLATVATSGDYDDLIDKPNLTLKEDVSNKVTLIDSASTDTEYPSAKAVYDTMTNWQTGTRYIENTTVYTVYSSPIALRASNLLKGVTYIYHFYISDNGMSGTKTYFEAMDSALYRIESSSYTRVISTRTGSRLRYSATDVRSYGTSPEYWDMFVTRVTDPVS